jgi:glycosyltransferase involved in cell wall biosynthesis
LTVKLTIAIPTHNRAALVCDTLASIGSLAIPTGVAADCVVVDNGSTDDTAAVVDAFAKSAAIPMRRVFEPRLGSSFARNRAIDETVSDFIFFIDDDAVAEPQWAAALLDDMQRRGLDAACGMVLPRWSSPHPTWLGPSLWVKLAVHDARAIESAPPSSAERLDNYFSANVGLKRDVFARFGKFREDLGVVGGNPISGEDTELFARIIARGGAMGFAPRAVVHHLIPPGRMTLKYLRRKSFAFGMGTAFAGLHNHNRLDKLVRNSLRMAAAAMRGDWERAIYHELECANFFGYWRGLEIRARRATVRQLARYAAPR